MANKKNSIKIRSKIKNYKRKIIILLTISCIIISILLVTSLNNILFTIQNFKKIKGIIETKLFDIQEEMEFKDAVFNFTTERGEKLIIIESRIKSNKSSKISIDRFIPYSMNNFYAKANRLNMKDKSLEDQIILQSDNAVVQKNLFKIKNNVAGEYLSKIDPKLNQSRFIADEVDFFHNLDIRGKNLVANNDMGRFTAGYFFLNNESDNGKFTKGVTMETQDYKITSEKLNAQSENGMIQNLLFKNDIVFKEKGGDKTIVYGDNAFYDNIKSNIKIYGNVKTYTTKNAFKAEGEQFYYNIITKKGYLKSSKNKKDRVEISLEI